MKKMIIILVSIIIVLIAIFTFNKLNACLTPDNLIIKNEEYKQIDNSVEYSSLLVNETNSKIKIKHYYIDFYDKDDKLIATSDNELNLIIKKNNSHKISATILINKGDVVDHTKYRVE